MFPSDTAAAVCFCSFLHVSSGMTCLNTLRHCLQTAKPGYPPSSHGYLALCRAHTPEENVECMVSKQHLVMKTLT